MRKKQEKQRPKSALLSNIDPIMPNEASPEEQTSCPTLEELSPTIPEDWMEDKSLTPVNWIDIFMEDENSEQIIGQIGDKLDQAVSEQEQKIEEEQQEKKEPPNPWIKLTKQGIQGRYRGTVYNVERTIGDTENIKVMQVQQKHENKYPTLKRKSYEQKVNKEKFTITKVQDTYLPHIVPNTVPNPRGRPTKKLLPKIIRSKTETDHPKIIEISMDDLAALTACTPPTPAAVQTSLQKHCKQGMDVALQTYAAVTPIIKSATTTFFTHYTLWQNLKTPEPGEAEQRLQQRVAALQAIHHAGELTTPITSVVRVSPESRQKPETGTDDATRERRNNN